MSFKRYEMRLRQHFCELLVLALSLLPNND